MALLSEPLLVSLRGKLAQLEIDFQSVGISPPAKTGLLSLPERALSVVSCFALVQSEAKQHLEEARSKLPAAYRTHLLDPVLKWIADNANNLPSLLKRLEEGTETQADIPLLRQCNIGRVSVMAIAQRRDDTAPQATAAFQELVSDLYASFLDGSRAHDIPKPKDAKASPFVRWGMPGELNTYMVDRQHEISQQIDTPIVCMPSCHAKAGLLAWSALGHETVGHDVLHAYPGLADEVKSTLSEKLKGDPTQGYWVGRFDDTVSDIMGLLYLGPAAGIGLIGYLRAARAAGGHPKQLASIDGFFDAEHPSDLLRGYLAAEVVGQLDLDEARRSAWKALIEKTTDADKPSDDKLTLQIGAGPAASRVSVTLAQAKTSLHTVVEAILKTPFKALHDRKGQPHTIGELDNWNKDHEAMVEKLIPILSGTAQDFDALLRTQKVYAAHVVAAAVLAAVSMPEETQDGAPLTTKIGPLFNNMITYLNRLPHRDGRLGLYHETPVDDGSFVAQGRLDGRSFGGDRGVVFSGTVGKSGGYIHQLLHRAGRWTHHSYASVKVGISVTGSPAFAQLESAEVPPVLFASHSGLREGPSIPELRALSLDGHGDDLTIATWLKLSGEIDSRISFHVFGSESDKAVLVLCPGGSGISVFARTSGQAWSRTHEDLTEALKAPKPAGRLVGHDFAAQKTQHVFYRGTDDHIHELWQYDGRWHHEDLTTALKGPKAASDPAAYVYTEQDTQHVLFLDEHGHIHELSWQARIVPGSAPRFERTQSWHVDLTTHLGLHEHSLAVGRLAAYACATKGTQHVVYRDKRDHLNELWWGGKEWHHVELTKLTGAPNPAGDPTAFMCGATRHIFYCDSAGKIHELIAR